MAWSGWTKKGKVGFVKRMTLPKRGLEKAMQKYTRAGGKRRINCYPDARKEGEASPESTKEYLSSLTANGKEVTVKGEPLQFR